MFQVTVYNGEGPLGVLITAKNLVTDVTAGGASVQLLRLGDRIVSVDGHNLQGRPIHSAIGRAPSHTFWVRWVPAAAKAAEPARAQLQGQGPGNLSLSA